VIVRAVLFVFVFAVAVHYAARTPAVPAWQERQAGRLECSLVLADGREDLVARYCPG
jgi:hypothetical protein